jgi:hypothetical protein
MMNIMLLFPMPSPSAKSANYVDARIITRLINQLWTAARSRAHKMAVQISAIKNAVLSNIWNKRADHDPPVCRKHIAFSIAS